MLRHFGFVLWFIYALKFTLFEGKDDEWKMEESPKWKLLAEIVEEIEKDEDKNENRE